MRSIFEITLLLGLCATSFAQTVDRRFNGTPEAFGAALPALFRQAVEGHHFRPGNYEAELGYLANLAQTCSEITPQMALKMGLPPEWQSAAQSMQLRKEDRKYAPCVPTWAAGFTLVSDLVGKSYNKETERGIVFSIAPVGKTGYESGRGFLLRVMFTALESDAPPARRERTQGEILIDDYRATLHVADVNLSNAFLAGQSTHSAGLEGLFDEFGIVCADIQGPGQHLGPPGACPPPIPHGAPGHSVDDTFARMVTVVSQNKAAGVPDALSPWLPRFTPLPVCYSITTRCEQTSEEVRVPGDLDVAPDFWEMLGRHCSIQAHTDRIEVSLKGSTPGGRKIYILCTTAFELATRRKTILRYGASGQTVRAVQPPDEQARPLPGYAQLDAVPSAAAQAMRNPPKFSGNADQFAAAFPGFLKHAAAAAGLDAQVFGKESAFVINSVRTCAQITPEMAKRTTRKDVPGGATLVNTRNLGDQYAICQAGGSSEPNVQYPDTSIGIQMLVGGGSWLSGKGFTAFVFFSRPKAGNYPIIYATLPGSSALHTAVP